MNEYLPYQLDWYEYEDDDDEEDWDDEPERWERICHDCDNYGIDTCQCCGSWLCGMHSEVGAGFCKTCPTDDWIKEQNNER